MARPREPMPLDVADALDTRGLRDAYDARPPYQRNDWLIRINAAKRADTRSKRIAEMLAELQAGEGYMGMAWRPARTGKQD